MIFLCQKKIKILVITWGVDGKATRVLDWEVGINGD